MEGQGLHTQTGTKMGTLFYMSPEQIKGEYVDEQADIYSLGITLYVMLAGKLPFENTENMSDFALMNKIVNEPVKDPREYYPAIPEWLVEIVYKAIEKDKTKRIKTIEEFNQYITTNIKIILLKQIENNTIKYNQIISSKKNLPKYCNGIKPVVIKEKYEEYYLSGNIIYVNQEILSNFENRTININGNIFPCIFIDDFLEDTLIKVNYRINDEYFIVPKYEGIKENEDIGFFIPVKKEYFDFFDPQDLEKNLRIKKGIGSQFTVELDIPTLSGYVTFRKQYLDNPQDGSMGKVETVELYFAFFPLFKVIGKDSYNDYYKIMFVDSMPDFETELAFYDELNSEIKLNGAGEKSVKKTIRDYKNNTITYFGTIYYESNFPSQFIKIEMNSLQAGTSKINGLIIPKYKEVRLGTRHFNVAIDFGTTNSHVVIMENNQTEPTSLKIGEKDLQVILFSQFKKDHNLTLTQQYENITGNVENKLIDTQRNQFIPSIIGEGYNPTYSFPIRTAIASNENFKGQIADLLGNINISFIFGKKIVLPNINISTNLKWELSKDDNEIKIKAFLEELLRIIRNKILLMQGDPVLTEIMWFKPLSMFKGYQNKYERLWKELIVKVFKNDNKYPIAMTESCAPYYYYRTQGKAKTVKPILSIDIGGGSTDVSFFEKDEPVFGTSFNFAGNSIWAPNSMLGFTQIIREGIYKYAAEDLIKPMQGTIALENLKNLLDLEKTIDKTSLHNDNLFNLLFSWDDVLKISDKLSKEPKIQFLILFHFSAIVYYCATILKLKGCNRPDFICLSGKGSKYLVILDASRNLSTLNNYITLFINKIFNLDDNHKTELVRVEAEKEATCMGGLFELKEKGIEGIRDTKESVLFYGSTNNNFKKLKYKEITEEVKNDITKGINKFVELFFEMEREFNFDRNFTIKLPKSMNVYRDIIENNLSRFLEVELQRRSDKFNPEDTVEDALFFYPLTHVLLELSKEFFDGN
jgi:hypothetical protein